MNEYRNALDYYNYKNNNYNNPTFTENVNANNTYDPYQGFIRGNMFPKLYNDYKLSSPVQLDNDLKTYYDALCFAAHDINLYLDIYPDDRDMIMAFSNYSNEAEKLAKEYQSQFGPLFVNSEANMVYPWAWDNEPWPWERGGN